MNDMTRLQHTIFTLLSTGLTDDEIGKKLRVSRRTLIRHIGLWTKDRPVTSRFQLGWTLSTVLRPPTEEHRDSLLHTLAKIIAAPDVVPPRITARLLHWYYATGRTEFLDPTHPKVISRWLGATSWVLVSRTALAEVWRLPRLDDIRVMLPLSQEYPAYSRVLASQLRIIDDLLGNGLPPADGDSR